MLKYLRSQMALSLGVILCVLSACGFMEITTKTRGQ